jgi:hypothetical protein
MFSWLYFIFIFIFIFIFSLTISYNNFIENIDFLCFLNFLIIILMKTKIFLFSFIFYFLHWCINRRMVSTTDLEDS